MSGYPGYSPMGDVGGVPAATSYPPRLDPSAAPASSNYVYTPLPPAAAANTAPSPAPVPLQNYGSVSNNQQQQQQPPSSSGAAISTAMGDESEAFEDLVEQEPEIKRDVTRFGAFDPRLVRPIQSMREPKTLMATRAQLVVRLLLLFNAVATIIMLVTAFKRNTSPSVVEQWGENWQSLTNFLTFTPIAALVLMILPVNNYFAERQYYSFLNKGIIIDFPNTSETRYLFTNWAPLAFIVVAVGYCLVAIGVMFAAGASLGTIVTIITQLSTLFIWWNREQSIEPFLVSLPQFIELFPSKEEKYKSVEDRELHKEEIQVDDHTLRSVVVFFKRLVLNQTEEPSWSGQMRSHRWENEHSYSNAVQWALRLLLVGFLGALIAGVVVYFHAQSASEVKDVWKQQLNTCTASCASVSAAAAPKNFTLSTCDACLCSCVKLFKKNRGDYRDMCSSAFSPPSVCPPSATASGMCSTMLAKCKNDEP